MPIYEFYCRTCHTVYSFFARSSSNDRVPQCPKCGRSPLEKQVSRFAISKGLKESESGPDPFHGVDEDKMERAMLEMAGDFENVNEDDPRQMAQMMRKLFNVTGMEPNDSIQEAIMRLEAGEDPDKVDEDMGGVLDSEDPFEPSGTSQGPRGRLRRLVEPPNVDPELYDL